MLIKAYGEFWRPQLVDWGQRGRGMQGKLVGRAAKGGKTVDVWEQSGIYVLYQDYKSVYVGIAAKSNLGARLRGHLTDRLAGRWNQFSWYGIRQIDRTKEAWDLGPEIAQTLSPRDVLDEIEAILISATEPVLNKQGGRFGVDVSKFEQSVPEPYFPREPYRVQEEETSPSTTVLDRLGALETAIKALESKIAK